MHGPARGWQQVPSTALHQFPVSAPPTHNISLHCDLPHCPQLSPDPLNAFYPLPHALLSSWNLTLVHTLEGQDLRAGKALWGSGYLGQRSQLEMARWLDRGF